MWLATASAPVSAAELAEAFDTLFVYAASTEAVAEGLGLGVVAETAYRPDPRLVKLTISDTSMATQVHFICRKERHQAPLISTFLGLAHSVSQKIA